MDGLTKKIKLNTGDFTLVDSDDHEELSIYNWHLKRGHGYAQRGSWNPETRKQSIVRMHRQIMNAPKGVEVDHINGNRLDNRKDNLRLVTRQQNSFNMAKSSSSISSYKGVSYRPERNRWRARIKPHGEEIFLGYFENEVDAAKAYDRAAVQYFGDYARLNFNEKKAA